MVVLWWCSGEIVSNKRVCLLWTGRINSLPVWCALFVCRWGFYPWERHLFGSYWISVFVFGHVQISDFTCLPDWNSALNLLLPGGLIHLCLSGYTRTFMVSPFPLNKSHAPVPLVSQSRRCCGMSHRPPGSTEMGGSQPQSLAWCWNTRMHFCSLKSSLGLLFRFKYEIKNVWITHCNTCKSLEEAFLFDLCVM